MILRFQFFLAELIFTCSIIGSSVYFDRTIVKLSCFLLYIARNSYQKKIKVLNFNLKSVFNHPFAYQWERMVICLEILGTY